MRTPWLLRLLLDPVEALDLRGRDGRPDHGKLMGAAAFALYAVIVLRMPAGTLPPLGLTIAFLAAMFGPRMFYRFLQRTQLAASEVVTREAREEIARRREAGAEDGAEPTP
jgi:hypothetical protein